MKHLTSIINEALLKGPAVEDNKVKILALVCDQVSCDSNLNLMKNLNKVCLVWTPVDGKGYIVANGGATWDDRKNSWTTLKSVDDVLGGKQDWKQVDDINVAYAYYSTVGKAKEYNIKVYSATVSIDDLNKVYSKNGKTLWMFCKSPATATLLSIFKEWRKNGYLSK